MPAQDRKGPIGQGAMTGRGAGPCNSDGTMPVCCRGFQRGRGFGRGFGWRIQMTQPVELSKEQEKKILEAELAELEAEKKELETVLKKIK